jgi:MoaA/NifB/PqqE/SkfB family radical SAM enzyme
MRCRFCISDARLTSMDSPQYLAALETLRARGFDQIVVGGGEPCEWPGDWRHAVREAKARGFHVQLGTNGVLLPDGFERTPAVDRFVLPMDAARGALHNDLRRSAPVGAGTCPDHYSLILRRLDTLRRAGREVTVSTVVNAANLAETAAIGKWLSHYAAQGGRVHAWHLYRFIPAGRGGANHAAMLDISDEAYEAAVHTARRAAGDLRVFKRPDMRHSLTVDFFWQEGAHLKVGSEVWKKMPAAEAC